MNFEAIKAAVITIQMTTNINRIDGQGWIVYRVGNIIRVDIKEKVTD
jgi:hypothetical protein